MRILVTGSRDWEDVAYIHSVLDDYYSMGDDMVPITLVSGACPKGADAICESYAAWAGWKIEEHPAQWDEYGKAAGFVRNSHMVALGADICLAFIKNRSKGATMTARLAQEAGIETIVWRIEDF